MSASPSDGALLRAVFRLEGERTVALAKLGRVPGAEAVLPDVDQQLGEVLASLEARGIAYPGHLMARHYAFSNDDYLLLQLALLARHGADAVREVTSALDDTDDVVRVSHAVQLLRPGRDDWEAAADALAGLVAVREGIVLLSVEDEDPALQLAQAARELMGLR